MPWGDHIHIGDLDRCLAVFDQFGETVGPKAVKVALTACAKVLTKELKSRAPVLTGNLKAKMSIKFLRPLRDGALTGVLVGASITGSKQALKSKVNRPPFYVLMIERGYYAGTRAFRSSSNQEYDANVTHMGHKYVAPNPFVQPSFDAVSAKLPGIFKKSIEGQAAKMANKATP